MVFTEIILWTVILAAAVQPSKFSLSSVIHYNIILPFSPSSTKLTLLSRFPTKDLYEFIIFPVLAACHPHFIPELITGRMFGEEDK
jgi:hypothetical protein